jgi:hypothetical protein
MTSGFPKLIQLQLLNAIDLHPGLDRHELAQRAQCGVSGKTVSGALIELRRCGWTHLLPMLARSESGRAHMSYEITSAGSTVLEAIRSLDESYASRVLRDRGAGLWPSDSELPLLQQLKISRSPQGLSLAELRSRAPLPARRFRDAIRSAQRKGYLRRDPLTGCRMLTTVGRGMLEIHRLTAQALHRGRNRSALPPRPTVPPTILQLTVYAVLLEHSDGMTAEGLREAMPAHTQWQSVVSALTSPRSAGWLLGHSTGFYKLTSAGRDGATAALARWQASFGVEPQARRAKRTGNALPQHLRRRAPRTQ